MTNTTEATIKELEEENELLLLQLHQVQEELERYYLRNKELEQGKGGQARTLSGTQAGTQAPTGWVDEDLPDILAEQIRLKAQLDAQQELHRLQTENALNARIGNLLIEAVDQGSVLSIPSKLIKIWRQSSQITPPAALGGKDFEQIIAAWQKDGFTAVEQLLAQVPASQAIKANAYTALARHLRNQDRTQAAEAAHRAYATDPKAYRLKWLALRLHEAGKATEAEALLDLLPADTRFSDSEDRQVSQLRYEAKQARQRQAQQQSNYHARRTAAEQQLRDLTADRNALQQSEAQLKQRQQEMGKELEALKAAKADLEAENTELIGQQQQLTQELDSLKVAKAELESDRNALQQSEAQLKQRQQELDQELEALKTAHAGLAQDKAELTQHRQALTEELESVKTAKAGLESDRNALQQSEAQLKQRQQEMGKELEALKAAKAGLESDRNALQHSEAQLKQRQQELGKELEALKAAKASLESEKSILIKQQQDTAQTAEARLKQINDLKQEIETRKAKEAELEHRQQLINEEMVRAEAQIDLIKDMFLREVEL
jgi:chromosome segregation ATPase